MNRPISRRTVLRGLGAALALPSLEAMRAARGAASAPPLRMAFLFVPNGVNVEHWFPRRTGFAFDLPQTLQPLARFQDDILVISGLTHNGGRANGDGPGDHARCASVFLTGTQPRKTSGAGIRVGVSVDQIAAKHKGSRTPLPSLELGCEPGRSSGNCDSGYSCAYSSSISWATPSTPLGKEVNPRLVFERLFSQGTGSSERRQRRGLQAEFQKSILDFVAEDARRLGRRLGPADRRKLDEYLEGVRTVEQRIAKLEERTVEEQGAAALAKPQGIPSDYGEHLRLMADMMVTAFQSDLTRIATFMFANAGSNRSYQMVGVPEGHHSLSHHGNNSAKLAKIAQINRFHVQQFAYLLERLRAIPEGDGTLLDHCMIVYGSGIHDGNRHNNENLPIILAGRANGTIDTGRHLRVPRETPMTNLFLSMLDRFGVSIDWMGDSTGRLSGLTL